MTVSVENMYLASRIVVLALVGFTSVSCDRNQSIGNGKTKSQCEEERDALASIEVGMSESDVLSILGNPDEIRIKGKLGIVAEKYRWVYGVSRPYEFPRIGTVVFDANSQVFMVHCPSRGLQQRLKDINLPISDSPAVTKEDLYCVVERVSEDEGYHRLTASIVNDGESPYLYRHDNQGIAFSVLLELFDEERTLLWREHLGGFHSPHSFNRSEWPVMRVAPDSRTTEDISIFSWLDENDGMFYPGTYYVRVAFPFHQGESFASNLFEFQLDKAVNLKADAETLTRRGTSSPARLESNGSR